VRTKKGGPKGINLFSFERKAEMTEIKNQTDDELETDRQALESKLDRLQRKACNEDRELTVSEKSIVSDINAVLADIKHEQQMRQPGRPLTLLNGPLGGQGHIVTPRTMGRTFREMFGYAPGARLDEGEFKSCAEFLAAIESGRFDPRLRILASMQEGTGSTGGFSVPPAFSADWLDASLPNEIVRNLCKVYPMNENELPVPGWDGADMSSGATHGGLTMTFLAESATATAQTPKMRRINLVAKMAAIYVDASVELVSDGRNFETNLQTALRSSMGYGIDRYCISGSGAGCPQGILNAPCKIQVQKESGQTHDTICYQNLKKMFARQLNPEQAVWLFNSTAIPELLEQSVAVGVAGSFVPLLNESNGKFTIFGRPVYFHPSMPTLGDEDDSAFVDFNFYALGLRQEVSIDVTDAVRWLQRERSFRILLRFDGMCTLNTAISPLNGDSLSPVVTLAERA
jgi:HK97 family phage major capsid protein